MAKVKDFLIGVEELVWTALEKGMTDEENIYSYVYMHEKLVDRDIVKNMLDSMLGSDYYMQVNQ
jgi:hypothetical protein